MSTRQAFVPIGRTNSSSNNSDDNTNKSPGNNNLAPPSGQPQTFKKDPVQKSQTDPPAKTLNISGLIPKNKTVQALKARHSKTIEGRPQSPSNTWNANAQLQLQIASPKPAHTSTATGIFTVATYEPEKKFSHTSPEPVRTTDSYGIPGFARTPPPLLLPVSHSSLKQHRASRQLEKVNEVLEEYEEGDVSDHDSLHASRHMDDQRRNQRVQSLPQVPNDSQESPFEGRMLRRTSKKRPNEIDEETDYGYAIKKFRSEAEPSEYGDSHMGQSSPLERRRENTVEHQVQQEFRPHTSAFEGLFGPEVEAHASKKMEQYESLKKKWSGCSMDEWKVGADDITSKVSDLLDLVKDRMVAKMRLYANLHKTFDEHNQVLDDRDKDLAGVQQDLVKSSGSVVGA